MSCAPDESLDTSEQFGEGERLCNVIIPASLQAAHPIVDRRLGAQNDDGCANVLFAQCLDHAKAVELWQHDVDHGDVIRNASSHHEALFSIGALIDRIAALLEAIGDK